MAVNGVVRSVAFVGLGAMGAGMARCLMRKGFTVRGYDVLPRPLGAFAADGGVACRSASEAGMGAEVALVIVLTADQAGTAIFGPDGLAETLAPGTPIACMTTMSPARSKALAEQAAAANLRWLDAPVSGGTQRAVEGTLTTMVGGDSADLERVREVLDAFSQYIFHLGPVGAGSTAKMVNQILVYCHLVATVEAMTFCRKAGADPQAVYDVIRTAMGNSAIFESRVPRMIDGSYESGGSLRIALKDLGIVEDAARELGMPMFMSAQANQLFRATVASGSIDQDDLAVAKLMEHLAGL